MVQAVVGDVVAELQGVSGPSDVFTIWGVGGVASGTIKHFIDQADHKLRGWVGDGPSDSSVSGIQEQVKGFEVKYACSQLLNSNRKIIVTDGFNQTLDGMSIQRATAMLQTYMEGIKQFNDEWKDYRNMLHDWTYVFNPEIAQGKTETGVPVTYDRVSEEHRGG